MRKKETRPTSIYWLVDTRTNTPFYCGKTVETITTRLCDHKRDAKRYPHRKSTRRIIECGENIAVKLVEIVPATGDWAARERAWIAVLRNNFPDTTNVAAGGQGITGLIASAETRAKLSAARKGKKLSPETVEKIRLGNIGKKYTDEAKAKIGAKSRGRKASVETRMRMRAARLGRKHAPETCAKIKAAWDRRKAAQHV